MSSDGGGFYFEANTPHKYKVVTAVECPDNKSSFFKACQELINRAGFRNKIELIEDGSTTSVIDTSTLEAKEFILEDLK